jgi:hypothetical protein
MSDEKDSFANANKEKKFVSISLTFNKNDVKIVNKGPYKSILIDSGIPKGKPGLPCIPWKKVFIHIPRNAVLGEIRVDQAETINLLEGIVIEPCQPNVPTLLGTKIDLVKPNQIFYSSKSKLPQINAQIIAIRGMGGFSLAEIEVCPFIYHLPEGNLELIRKIDLTLIYTQETTQASRPFLARRYEQKFAEHAKRLVINKQDIEDIFPIQEFYPEDFYFIMYPQVDHVIITSKDLADKFQKLSKWRSQMGLRSRVVTVEDIIQGKVPDTGNATFWYASGYVDGGTRDPAEAIRNFIKWASVNWLIDYVLLGGDTEIIPCRYGLIPWIFDYGNINDANTDPAKQLAFSAQASTQKSTSPASNVLDDGANTVWESDPSDTSPWIQVSIGSNTLANRMDLQWGSKHATSYQIQASLDGVNWINVYSTTSASGGNETVNFNCVSAQSLRVKINSGTSFSLASIKVYGPFKNRAYSNNSTTTRLYLETWISPDTANPLSGDLLLIKEGPYAGLIIPYDVNASDTKLGWHFVNDLLNPTSVPTTTTYFIEIRGPSQYHLKSFACKVNDNYIPTDLYYSDIASSEYPSSNQHDWDADGNKVYGEQYPGSLDEVNGIPDLYVGRAPVETPEEADIFVSKIIRYEKFQDEDGFLIPKDFAVSVLLGAQNWFGDDPNALDPAAAGKEDIKSAFIAFDPNRWKFTRRYQDFQNAPSGSDLAQASHDEILNGIKNGNNVVSLSSHGDSGYLCYLTTNDLDDVANIPSLFYGNACSTNKFDVQSPSEALSEWSVLDPHGGAVAYLGNSRFGWVGDNYIEKKYWDKLLDSDRIGEMLNQSKIISHDWGKYSLNLMGDPAMRVWSDRPKEVIAIYSSEICTGNQNFSVTVTFGGGPIKDALVCATMEGSLFVVGTTDAAGKAVIKISPSMDGIMKVSVSGKNLLPHLGSVKVKKCPGVCQPIVVCGSSICSKTVLCSNAIFCTKLLGCASRITCANKLVQCDRAIFCFRLGVCQMAVEGFEHGCPSILPEDMDWYEHILEIWRVPNLEELARRYSKEEIQKKIEVLPVELKKPIKMMLKRIIEERQA